MLLQRDLFAFRSSSPIFGKEGSKIEASKKSWATRFQVFKVQTGQTNEKIDIRGGPAEKVGKGRRGSLRGVCPFFQHALKNS